MPSGTVPSAGPTKSTSARVPRPNSCATFISTLFHADGYFTPGATLSHDISPCQRARSSVTGYAGVQLSFLGLPIALVARQKLFQTPYHVWYLHGHKCD